MSSMLVLEERMSFLIKEEKKYLNKLKEKQNQFGSMAPHGIQDLISFCNIKLAQEEITKELTKKIAQEQLAKEIAKQQVSKI